MKLFVFIFSIFFSTVVASQNIVYCPKEIKCKGQTISSCSFSDNQNNLWEITGTGGSGILDHSHISGVFKFSKVSIVRDSRTPKNAYDIVSCDYQQKHSKGERTLTATPMFRLFEPLLANSLWIDYSTRMRCSFENSVVCPMIEMPGIVISKDSNPYVSFYYTDKNTGEYKHISRLLYDDLIEICGFTSSCIIDIGQPHSISGPKKTIWYYDHYGVLDLDISIPNKVTLNQLNTDFTQSECVLEKHKPFNAFYCKK